MHALDSQLISVTFHILQDEWVDLRTYVLAIFSEPKFVECIDNQIFFPMVLHAWRSSALRNHTFDFLSPVVNMQLFFPDLHDFVMKYINSTYP